MDTPAIVHDLVPVILSICYVILVIDSWRRQRRDRWVEQEIRRMYDEETKQGEPVYQILQIADLLEIEWEGWDEI